MEVEKLNGLYRVQPSTPSSKIPFQSTTKVVKSSVSAFNSKGPDSELPSTPAMSATAFISSSRNRTSTMFGVIIVAQEVIYACECPHCTLALEHKSKEPLELEEEVVEPEESWRALLMSKIASFKMRVLELLGVPLPILP